MESIPFITVDSESISLSQSLQYLRESGLFPQVLADILRQHLLRKELQSREEITINSFQIAQSVMDFRIESQLSDENSFQQWLNDSGMTYDAFEQQILFRLKLEKLKDEIAEPKLEEYFKEQKPLLDRVILSRIVVTEKELAENLKQQILQNPNQFEALAKEHSITEDRIFNGMMGPIAQGTLLETLKSSIELANPGDIIGPLEIDECYCLFRVEEFLPATLEGELKEELQDRLFEQWIQEKLQLMEIKLEVD